MKTKVVKKTEAIERKQAREVLDAKDQLKVLDARLGKGVGAVKERGLLAKKIEEANA